MSTRRLDTAQAKASEPSSVCPTTPTRVGARCRRLLVLLVTTVSPGCGDLDRTTVETAPVSPAFVEVSSSAGIDFEHRNGMTGEYYFAEMAGPGGGVLDFDGDGDLDLLLLQGHHLAIETSEAPARAERSLGRLYRNDSDPARGLRFVDVTAASGLLLNGYGMGVATGDIDNDGDLDLYAANFGANQLWSNEGDGTFRDVTASSGTDDPRWSTSASFLDFDSDGWLDLFVVNYVDFRLSNHKPCSSFAGVPDYCGPLSYRPVTDRVFRNRGDGTFEDASARLGILGRPGNGLGLVTGDFDGDGDPDVFVANDQMENALWINEDGKRFADEALLRGCAVDAMGRAQASMGVDAGDVDSDGDLDLFATHLLNETNTLYVNDGDGFFRDASVDWGLATPSRGHTGFGTSFLDFDNDGELDLFVVNGAVRILEGQLAEGDPHPLKQRNKLFRGVGGRFVDATDLVPDFDRELVSRGSADGDLDNDGDPDLVVLNNHGPMQLLENGLGAASPWLGVDVVGRSGGVLFGAGVRLRFVGGESTLGRIAGDGSYLAINDPRARFGLGARPEVDAVEIFTSGVVSLEVLSPPRDTYLRFRVSDGPR